MGLINNFTGQWLQVRDFGKTMTDRNQYKSYTDELQKSEWQEPYEFFNEVLRGDLSILNFLDSDFLVIDKQLADHYGIDGVKEVDGFQEVAITPQQHRGGVLGMAGVLTYLTDGFRTLPVRRAAYVNDRLWNEPAKPPPPNVGDLPAVKGKNLTVRQRLEQHRDSASCASCHAHLDPFGIALENYDAIGKWRERQNGEGFKGRRQIAAAGRERRVAKRTRIQRSGGIQAGIAGGKRPFRSRLHEKDAHLRLGAFGRGHRPRDVDGIVQELERDEYRMQSLLQAVVASEAFRMK